MRKVILILIALISIQISAQTISGTVLNMKNEPIEGANIYLEGTYDGSTSGEDGSFSFETQETGTQTLVVSFLSYETFTMVGDISFMKDITVKLREDVNTLDAVVLSAGTFSAGDNSKVNALKPLDVVTTASALGDFVGALQTLPGTTTVAEDGRLFVRGGGADETQIFIDGIRVFTPYSPTTNNAPTRGRYSPFLFDGITFSTGGYSAEFGQALSSVLLLNTINEPDQEKTDIGIMSVGASLGNTQKWEKSSLSFKANYINLAPYLSIFKDKNTWMFSATMPKDISNLAGTILKDPITVEVTPASTPVEVIEQRAYHLDRSNKPLLLIDILKNQESESVLVFTKTKYGADRVAKHLDRAGFACASIHSNRSQGAREKALNAFRSREIKVLVATDIAARGIDVDSVSHVINYDVPLDAESYVHRIGRTARAGRDGSAMLFCDPSESKYLKAVEKLVGYKIQEVKDHPYFGAPPRVAPVNNPQGKLKNPNLKKKSKGKPNHNSNKPGVKKKKVVKPGTPNKKRFSGKKKAPTK